MAERRIRITGPGIYGQATDENPTGEYPIGYEFSTDAELPAGWKGRAEVVGEEPAEGSTFVVDQSDESEAGRIRNDLAKQAQGEIDRITAQHKQDTALLRDRAERAEADLQSAKEQIEDLTERLKAFEIGEAGESGAATADEIKAAVDMLDTSVDDHWTAAGLPAVDAVAELVGKPVTRAAIADAAPDAKRAA